MDCCHPRRRIEDRGLHAGRPIKLSVNQIKIASEPGLTGNAIVHAAERSTLPRSDPIQHQHDVSLVLGFAAGKAMRNVNSFVSPALVKYNHHVRTLCLDMFGVTAAQCPDAGLKYRRPYRGHAWWYAAVNPVPVCRYTVADRMPA